MAISFQPLREWNWPHVKAILNFFLWIELNLTEFIYLLWIWHSEDRASWFILIMKANEMHYFSNLFNKVFYMFRTSPLSIISSISTLYTQQQLFVMLLMLAFITRRLHSINSKQVNTLNTEQVIMDFYKLLHTVVSYCLLKNVNSNMVCVYIKILICRV